MDPNKSYGVISDFYWIKMVITWREREHEEQHMISVNDPGTVEALRDYQFVNRINHSCGQDRSP